MVSKEKLKSAILDRDVEIRRLRALLHTIAAQTDPKWGQWLAREEVGTTPPAERSSELLVEWRDAREVIFATEKPTPEMFTRLGAAELALMTLARTLLKQGAKDDELR